MQDKRKVSVALATYNGAIFLPEQLQSLARQTRLPAELVVSDDGSTDGTLNVVRDFAATAPFPVRIEVSGEKLGFADNFLFAAERCSSEAVAFCDQDDVWLPHKLSSSLDRLERDGSALVMHRLVVTDQSLSVIEPLVQGIYGDNVFSPLELDPFMEGWGNSMTFDRRLLSIIPRERRPKQSRISGRPLSHDTWVYMLAAALGRTSHIMEPLILYRQHSSNTMGLGAKGWHTNLLELIKPRTKVHRERADINSQMAILLKDASMTHAWFADAAAIAAASYHERYLLAAARVEIFDGHDIGARYRAYRTMLTMSGDNKPRYGSRVKDLVLGVARIAPTEKIVYSLQTSLDSN